MDMRGCMSRIELLEKKYPEQSEIVLSLLPEQKDNKFWLWVAEQLTRNYNLSDIKSTLNFFKINKDRLKFQDIYQYQDLKVLENEIKSLTPSKRTQIRVEKDKGSYALYNDDDYSLYRVTTRQAMMYYGKNTKWCVAMEDSDYWEDYSFEGLSFYVLICKKDNTKFAIVKNEDKFTIEIFNERDIEEYQSNFFKLHKYVISEVLADNFKNYWKILNYIDNLTWVSKPNLEQLKFNLKEFYNWFEMQHDYSQDYIINNTAHGFLFFKEDISLSGLNKDNWFILKTFNFPRFEYLINKLNMSRELTPTKKKDIKRHILPILSDEEKNKYFQQDIIVIKDKDWIDYLNNLIINVEINEQNLDGIPVHILFKKLALISEGKLTKNFSNIEKTIIENISQRANNKYLYRLLGDFLLKNPKKKLSKKFVDD